MMHPGDLRARNQRIAVILIGTAVALLLGSVIYIDWYHAAGPGAVSTRQK